MVPKENLDNIVTSIAEGKEVSGKNIYLEIIGNQLAKTIDRLAHIGGADGDIDFALLWKIHDLPPESRHHLAQGSAVKIALDFQADSIIQVKCEA